MEQMESENDIKSEDLEQISNISGNLSYWSVQLRSQTYYLSLVRVAVDSLRIFFQFQKKFKCGIQYFPTMYFAFTGGLIFVC